MNKAKKLFVAGAMLVALSATSITFAAAADTSASAPTNANNTCCCCQMTADQCNQMAKNGKGKGMMNNGANCQGNANCQTAAAAAPQS